MQWIETPVLDAEAYLDASHQTWTVDDDGIRRLNSEGMSPRESAQATADHFQDIPDGHLYAITHKAINDLGGELINVPMPKCAHGVFFESNTDNYLVVRAPDDLSEINIGKFLSTTLAGLRGVRPVSIYFGNKG